MSDAPSSDAFDDFFAEFQAPLEPEEPLDPIRQMSLDIETKQAELEKRRNAREYLVAQKKALREQMAKLTEKIQEMEVNEQGEFIKDNTIRREISDLERKIEEEEHRRKEAERLAELDRRRTIAMAGFKNKIAELEPAWEKYPHDYQWEGAGTLALMGSGLLGDEMGLGKTLTSIMWLDLIEAKRVLIVGPNETINNFGQEVLRWSPHRFLWSFAGNTPKERNMFMDLLIDPRKELDQNFTVCVNYEQLQNDRDFQKRLKECNWDAVIIDEAHNMKNKNSVLFQRMQVQCFGVKHVLPMTGTFILNEPQDIWTSLHLIDNLAFPEMNEFLHNYCEFNYSRGRWVFRSGGVASLVKHMQGRIVMRTFEEVQLSLPPEKRVPAQLIHEEWIHFDNDYFDQRKVMKQLAEFSQIVLDTERKSNIIENLALITRNRQAINWPAGININVKDPDTKEILYTFSVGEEVQESIKMDWVERKARELEASGKRVVVFSQFKTVLSALEKRLSDLAVVRYDGDTDKDTRDAVKNDFDRRHVENRGGTFKWSIVLCNFKTGGVGLNFTHATETIIFDEEWNPGKNEQAYRRTKRIGQTEETHVYVPRVEKSIDSWMHSLNNHKRDLVDGFNLEVDMSQEFANFLGEALGD